ncbi:MAG: hypothetical protein QOG62_769 [Thermoleophilaceae bacterium]|jgi:two-component system cell cycle response regulator|nr:hypothetical protein [Thermoleophilaceae bacterium]
MSLTRVPADRQVEADLTRSRPTPAETEQTWLAILQERMPELRLHSDRVASLAQIVGEDMGLRPRELTMLRSVAELHDLGKLIIPRAILDRAGPLDGGEWALLHTHTVVGQRLLESIPGFEQVARLTRSTHERWDGAGYPDGLAGTQIPLGSRIVFVCDAFDAMTSPRPYRRAMTSQTALGKLQKGAGTQFDARVVRVLSAIVAECEPAPSAVPALN